MKVVVALDGFKETLGAPEACRIVHDVLLRERPHWDVIEAPMADGGEGTAAAMAAAAPGELLAVQGTEGPLPGTRVDAHFAWLPRTREAVVEMAAASGLALIVPAARNPMVTSTRGTGELIAAALRHGPRRILLGLGGSATVDGGTGAAAALGWQFRDRHDRPLRMCGQALRLIRRIMPPDPTKHPRLPEIEALCDVKNTLCGPRGAAAVYGPQKGATPEMVAQLEDGLQNLALCVQQDLGLDLTALPGGGAAGGFGAGAVAFLGARLVPGIERLAAACNLAQSLAQADWVITGEGCFDAQSLNGKVVSGVSRIAAATGVPVAVVAGRVRLAADACRAAGVEIAVAAAGDEVPDAAAHAQARERLAAAAARLVPALERPATRSAAGANADLREPRTGTGVAPVDLQRMEA